MYSAPALSLKYIKYYMTAANGKGHGVHSPFVFDFVTNVLNDSRYFYAYDSVERLRADLLEDKTLVAVVDFGAGSATAKTGTRNIAAIARAAAKPKKFGQLLFRMVDHYQAKTIIELGTSLGITTAYLAAANLRGSVYTFEGAPAIAALARQNFAKLRLNNTYLTEGNFDDTLATQLAKIGTVDFAFIDGNHRKEPTLQYFSELLEKADEHTVFVFDDIHWSQDMEQAWAQIKNSEAVTLSIDLFFIGIVFFRKEHKTVQHFTVRF